MDSTSSAITISNKYKVAVDHPKDGKVNLYTLSNKFEKILQYKSGFHSYGHPVIIPRKERFDIISKNNDRIYPPVHQPIEIYSTLENKKHLEKYNFSIKRCVGDVPSKPSESTVAASYFYSGSFRNNLIMLKSDGLLYNDFQKHNSLYLSQKYYPDSLGNKIWAKYLPERKLKAVHFLKKKLKNTKKIEIGFKDFIFYPQTGKTPFEKKIDDFFYYYENKLCLKRDNRKLLYRFVQERDSSPNLKNEDTLTIFSLKSTQVDIVTNKLKSNWIHKFKPGYRFQRSNISALKTTDEKYVILVPLEFIGKEFVKNPKLIALINSENGQLLREIPISGRQHFSQVIVQDSMIISPTKNKLEIIEL